MKAYFASNSAGPFPQSLSAHGRALVIVVDSFTAIIPYPAINHCEEEEFRSPAASLSLSAPDLEN
jgi:hypothetical protein